MVRRWLGRRRASWAAVAVRLPDCAATPEVFCEGVSALVAGVCAHRVGHKLLFSTVVRQDGA